MPSRTDKPTRGVLIFEKKPYWGPELKRQLTDQPVLVRECRSLGDLLPAAAELTAAVAVLVLDAAPVECLDWMVGQVPNEPFCSFVVIAPSELGDLEWPIREAGADEFLHDEMSGSRLSRICLRLLKQTASAGRRLPARSDSDTTR